jgi:GAF domain-containing protein
MFSIEKLMRSLYVTLEAHYADQGFLDELIRFETTFMTESYRDNEITIAAWANKDGREPVSLQSRRTKADLYKDTETARAYHATSEEERFRIIEDTTNDRRFHKVYGGQTDRIKSIIVYPVRNDKNEILGTLVAHCDERSFFKEAERTYWRELLEIFAKRIALEKKRLDLVCKNDNFSPSDYPF